MIPAQHFKFCPRCAQAHGGPVEQSRFRCSHCNFLYYFNPALAAAGFIADTAGRILFVRRAKDPAKGKLGVPGGFIDIGETAEDAFRREAREETNLELTAVTYLCSRPNIYHYKDVTYPVLDLFFVGRTADLSAAKALDGVDELCWLPPDKVDREEIAFPSVAAAFEVYLRRAL